MRRNPVIAGAGMNGIEIIHGDCLDVMPTLPAGSFDAIVTDPPYGTEAPSDGYGRRADPRFIAGDTDLSVMAGMLSHAPRLLIRNAWVALFCSPKRRYDAEQVIRAAGFGIFGEIVWDKQQPGLGGGIRYQHETILLCSLGKPSGKAAVFSVLRHSLSSDRRGKGHPHEKPVSLMSAIVRYCCPEGGRVLDPTAGSGSTLVACAKTGRQGLGIESEGDWCEVSHRRLRDAATPIFDRLETASAS